MKGGIVKNAHCWVLSQTYKLQNLEVGGAGIYILTASSSDSNAGGLPTAC